MQDTCRREAKAKARTRACMCVRARARACVRVAHTHLVDGVRREAPQDDGDASLAGVLVHGKRVDAVFEVNVDVPPEREHHPIGLQYDHDRPIMITGS